MTIAHVAGQSGQGIVSYGATTIPVTMALTPIAGNVLVAAIGTLQWASPAITVDSISQIGVTWTRQNNSPLWDQANVEIWLGVVGSSPSTSITVNLSGSILAGAVADVYEYSRVATSSFLDKIATNIGFSEYPDTGTTAATTQAAELWIGATLAAFNSTNQSTPTNGFTMYDGVAIAGTGGNYYSLAFLEKIVSATGTANSGTTTAASGWTGCIATLKGEATATPALVTKVSTITI